MLYKNYTHGQFFFSVERNGLM